jgi:glycosyltransferase involved in cell wall biosynthesis
MEVLFVGPIGDFSVRDGGYGNASLGMLNVLTKMCGDKSIPYLTSVDYISTLDISKIIIPDKEYDVILMVTNPISFQSEGISVIFKAILAKGKKNYLSLVWETEPLPKSWEFLWEDKDLFDGFVTPSYFVGNQIIKYTVKPVYYFPHYIDIDLFKPIDINEKMREKRFSVLFMGQNTKRKSLKESIISYVRALHPHKDTQLILKYHDMTSKETSVESMVKIHTETNCSKFESKIYSLTNSLTPEEVNKLYQNVSLLLFPSKGEGFGLPLAEAMCVGLPVIYTNWSACPEIASAAGNIAVDCYLDETYGMVDFGYEYGSVYAYPMISSLTNAIRNKYNLWRKDKRMYYEEVQVNRNIINNKFGYESIKKYLDIIFTGEEKKKITS